MSDSAPFMARARFSAILAWAKVALSRGSGRAITAFALAAMVAFLIGVIASMWAWMGFKLANPGDPPLGGSGSARGGDTIIYNGTAATSDIPVGPETVTRVETSIIERVIERCPTPPKIPVCPPVEPSKLCRCSGRP